MKPRGGPLYVPSTTARDALIAGVCGLVVLGFVAYGIIHFAKQSTKAKANTLTGIVVEREFLPMPEEQIRVGKQGLAAQRTDGEYVLKVRVDRENGRIFEVPVDQSVYETKKIGDSLTFLRPPSERQ